MAKRSRADTSAALHPSARLRVDGPEIQLNLFNDNELADLKRSLFDGQLSDITLSDAESVPLSMTDTEDEDLDSAPTDIPSGDWSGTRDSLHNYRLPGDSKGPDPEKSSLVPTPLDKPQKRFIASFCNDLMQRWPSEQLNQDLANDRHLALADPTAFWNTLLQQQLGLFVGYLQNLKPDNQGNVSPIFCSSISY